MFICFPHYIMGLTGDARVVTADAVVGVSKLKGLNSFAFGSNLNFRIALRNKEPTQSAWCVCVCVYKLPTHSSFLLGSDVVCVLSSSLSSGMEEVVE